jgi:hypothetical protein
MLPRLFSGLLAGVLISLVVCLVVVVPAVLLIRLIWGVWPTPAAQRWIVSALGGQALMLAARHAIKGSRRVPKDPISSSDAHGSAPP